MKAKQAVFFVKLLSPLIAAALTLASANTQATTQDEVVTHYANLAEAIFEDSVASAKTLQQDIQQLLDAPSEASLAKARASWRAARVPYQQSEVFRFGNALVDEWEGQVNSWPLDEGLIDYVASGYHAELGNVAGQANIIGNPKLTIGTTTLDLSIITPELLADLNELAGSEANVATGYHAIEFLLWGQDLNGTGPGAGQRPHTDFVTGKNCSGGNCDRRRQYLLSVTSLLISDLNEMHDQWRESSEQNYRDELLASPSLGIQKMLFGMGSLSLGELAGERMKVALEAGSTEDEHDCFSDNTHFSHYYNAKGIENIYFGRYQRLDGTWLKGPSLSDLVKEKNPKVNQAAVAAFEQTDQALMKLVNMAEKEQNPMKFDQMIAEGNKEGADIIIRAINALVAQTQVIETVAKALGIEHLNPDTADHQF